MRGFWYNLYKVYALAGRHDIESGQAWYHTAHEWAQNVADSHGLPLEKVVHVTAALSQNNKWENNMIDTEKVLTAWKYGIYDPKIIKTTTYHNAVRKALNILDNDETATGAKVECFAHNILHPGKDDEVVTVDQWAYRAWVWDTKATKKSLSRSLISRISEDYVTVARMVGHIPHEFQAIVWLVVRNAQYGLDNLWQQTVLL